MFGELWASGRTDNTASLSANPSFVGSGPDERALEIQLKPPRTTSIKRPCGVVVSAQGSPNDLKLAPAFAIASRVAMHRAARLMFPHRQARLA